MGYSTVNVHLEYITANRMAVLVMGADYTGYDQRNHIIALGLPGNYALS